VTIAAVYRIALPAASALLVATPLAAQDTAAPGAEQPLVIEILSGLTFSRLALTGKGQASAAIDPQTGAKRTDGGVVDLGGMAVEGRARITGEPHRSVRVTFPGSVTMTSTTGGTAELSEFTTDLPAWPVLDAGGFLEFSFGGRLKMAGPVGGSLRGRIPISVDYN
jgi:Domain of unknown function (DUF4402)